MENLLKEQRAIINSKPIRRLADKTQVMSSMDGNVQIRTRLTHSLEVASIAQEIAFNIDKVGNYKLNPVLIYNVSLLHDVGMAPLGHLGESTLNKVVSNFFGLHFEANANNISMIEAKIPDISPLTMVSTIKYPFLIKENEKGKGLYETQYKKYVPLLKEVIKLQNQSEIERLRTYECDIMEISDDLAYLFSDLEDYLSIVKEEDKISSESMSEIFKKFELNNPNLYLLMQEAIEKSDKNAIEKLRNEIISEVKYLESENKIDVANEDYLKLLKIVRYIDWNYYISKHSLTCDSNVILNYESMLNYLFSNIEKEEIINEYIYSSTKKREYKESKTKIGKAKVLLVSMSELTDSFVSKLINKYLKKEK